MEITQLEPGISTAPAYRSYQGGHLKVLVSYQQTNGTLSLIQFTLPKGSEPPTHIHFNEDETFYILEGEVAFLVGEEHYLAKPGDSVFGPRGVKHHFQIQTPQATILTTITPGNFQDFFVEFSQPADSEPAVAPLQGPPPPEAIAALLNAAQRHGVQFLRG